MSNDTEILEKHPLLKAVIDYCLKHIGIRLEILIVAAIVGGCNHHSIQNSTKWIGQHLDDKQQQIDQLKGGK